jgi:hypothetical protein
MLGRVEPVATFFYPCAWYGLIFTLDRLIRWREHRSLLRRLGLGGWALFFWSAVVWYGFEAFNLRLHNWHYVFVADQSLVRTAGAVLSFATVFPGIFWIEHLLAALRLGNRWRGRRRHFAGATLWAMQAIGLLGLGLCLVYPRYCFPLLWVGFVLLVEPFNHRRGIGLLSQIEAGDYRPVGRQLVAGLLAGLLWESLNFWARTKWIYTVPFFEELKLFEMPLAGFLGFPPFAVQCAAIYRLLVWYHLAPAFGGYSQRRPRKVATGTRVALAILAAVAALSADHYMNRLTVVSVTPAVARVERFDRETRLLLRAAEVYHLTDLEGRQAPARWQALAAGLDPVRLVQVKRLSALYLHQGIGVEYGNLLVRAGIDSLGALAVLSAEQVWAKLERVAPSRALPPLALVRVWVRRAASARW